MTNNAEKTIPFAIEQQMFQIKSGLANGGFNESAVKACLQAIIEKQPFEQSSLSTKVMKVCEGVELTEMFLAQRITFKTQAMKRHRNGGGWVPLEQDEHDLTRPFVAETAFVGPFAIVSDWARVYHDARVASMARVCGSAQVFQYARIYGHAEICDKARVSGNAQVFGDAVIAGKAEVHDDATVSTGLHRDGYISGHI